MEQYSEFMMTVGHDFNDPHRPAFARFIRKPEIGETIFVTDYEGNSVFGSVTSVHEPKNKDSEYPWHGYMDLDFDTWEHGIDVSKCCGAPEIIIEQSKPYFACMKCGAHPVHSKVFPEMEAILRGRIINRLSWFTKEKNG